MFSLRILYPPLLREGKCNGPIVFGASIVRLQFAVVRVVLTVRHFPEVILAVKVWGCLSWFEYLSGSRVVDVNEVVVLIDKHDLIFD